MMKKTSARTSIASLLAASFLLVACGGNTAQTPATASITAPTSNAQFQAGDEVKIEGKVTGSTIKQVDIFINNEKFATVDKAARPNEFDISLAWTAPAETAGTSVIQLKGINDKGESVIASDAVFVNVQASEPTVAPTIEPTPIPTAAAAPQPTVDAAARVTTTTTTTDTTASPSVTSTTGTTATTPATQSLLTPKADFDFVNVRAQPDVTAQQIGQLNKGQSVPVRGRNADSTWFQITFPAGPGGVGWVASLVANVTGVTTTLPVVAASTTVTATGATTTTASTTITATVPTNPANLQPPFVKLKVGQDFANVRTGPDVAYQRVGELNVASVNAAAVKGKSANGQWWQINFPSAPGGVAWVYSLLVDLTGNAAQVAVATAPPLPTAAPAAPVVTATAPAAPAAPAVPQPTPTAALPASAVLPYSQNMRFSPRDDIGDVPLGFQGQPRSATLEWQINGATKAELEITTVAGTGIFANCPVGNLGSISPNDAAGKRIPLQLPSGTYNFTINDKGYYLFKIYVVKADGSTTDIPRNVIVDCFKTQ